MAVKKKVKKHTTEKKRKRTVHHSAPAKRRKRRTHSGFSGLGSIGKRDAMQAELTNLMANVVLRIVNSFLFGKSGKAGIIPGIDTSDPLKKNAILYLIINFFGARLGKGKVMTGVQEIIRTRLSDAIIDKFAGTVDFLSNDFRGTQAEDIYEDENGKKYLMVNGRPIALSGEFEDSIEISGNDIAYGSNEISYGADDSEIYSY